MRKFLTIVFSVFFINSFACDRLDLLGTWVSTEEDSPRVEITFICDSIYIDEIGNEGMCYSYHVVGDSIIYQDCIEELYNITSVMHIVYLDEKMIGIVFDDDSDINIYMYNKKED